MFRFRKKYICLTALLFLVEITIAVFIHDKIIRPYIGDMLVVILLYCFIRSFLNIPALTAALSVLLFSYTIEVLQYFNLVQLLGLQKSKLATIILGCSFGWIDILAYTLGIALVIWLEKVSLSKLNRKTIKS